MPGDDVDDGIDEFFSWLGLMNKKYKEIEKKYVSNYYPLELQNSNVKKLFVVKKQIFRTIS